MFLGDVRVWRGYMILPSSKQKSAETKLYRRREQMEQKQPATEPFRVSYDEPVGRRAWTKTLPIES